MVLFSCFDRSLGNAYSIDTGFGNRLPNKQQRFAMLCYLKFLRPVLESFSFKIHKYRTVNFQNASFPPGFDFDFLKFNVHSLCIAPSIYLVVAHKSGRFDTDA